MRKDILRPSNLYNQNQQSRPIPRHQHNITKTISSNLITPIFFPNDGRTRKQELKQYYLAPLLTLKGQIGNPTLTLKEPLIKITLHFRQ